MFGPPPFVCFRFGYTKVKDKFPVRLNCVSTSVILDETVSLGFYRRQDKGRRGGLAVSN